MKKRILAIVLALIILSAPVFADTTFTFRVPGAEGEQKSEAAKKIEAIIDIIKREYYKDVKEEDLINGAIKGIFEALDSHSTYFSPEDYKEFMIDLEGEIVGIGVQIERRDGRVTVVAPIEGTPAYKAGIKTGDKIVEVDGTDITEYTTDQAANLIRGKEGTEVEIGIIREGSPEIIYYKLIREVIEIIPVKYEIKEGNIGYIRITEFSGKTYSSMVSIVNEFKEKGIKGVIIDVRGNPGGLLDEVVEVCRLLIPEGPIVKIQVKNEIKETYMSDLDEAPFKLVVLVDKGSASASEILAGAVKDSNTGIIVGEKTYGKGTVQNVMRISGGGGVKITIANYLTPNNFSLDGIGITPDIEVKRTDSVETAEFAPVKGDRSIKNGHIGLDVLGVQQRLKALGYDINKLDGIFGGMTRAAVLNFQKDNNLSQDASIDADDIKILEEKLMQKQTGTDLQLERAMEEIRKMLQ
ncbi:MAG: PDZ domain-containing protein [Gracilibacteraceae bacterium]|nr:PDZ domain-containing protein [Gracilibacteraceae bacterium]